MRPRDGRPEPSSAPRGGPRDRTAGRDVARIPQPRRRERSPGQRSSSRSRSLTRNGCRRIERTRCSTPTARTRSSGTGSWPMRPRRRAADGGPDCVADLLGERLVERVRQEEARQGREGRAAGARRPRHRDFTADGPEPAVAGRHHRTSHGRGKALPLRDQGRVVQPDRRLLHRLTDEVPPGRRGPGQRRSPTSEATVAGCVLHSDRGVSRRIQRAVATP